MPIGWRALPFLNHFLQRQVSQSHGGDIGREIEERGALLPVAPPTLGNRWIFAPPFSLTEFFKPLAGKLGIRGLVKLLLSKKH